MKSPTQSPVKLKKPFHRNWLPSHFFQKLKKKTDTGQENHNWSKVNTWKIRDSAKGDRNSQFISITPIFHLLICHHIGLPTLRKLDPLLQALVMLQPEDSTWPRLLTFFPRASLCIHDPRTYSWLYLATSQALPSTLRLWPLELVWSLSLSPVVDCLGYWSSLSLTFPVYTMGLTSCTWLLQRKKKYPTPSEPSPHTYCLCAPWTPHTAHLPSLELRIPS